jgi:hypothetical protein
VHHQNHHLDRFNRDLDGSDQEWPAAFPLLLSTHSPLFVIDKNGTLFLDYGFHMVI